MDNIKKEKSIIRILYQCKVDDVTLRRTFEQVKVFTLQRTSYNSPFGWRLARTEFYENGEFVGNNYLPHTSCPAVRPHDIPHGMEFHVIKGTIVNHHQCNSKCLNATSNICNCSCGGANHGKAYDVVQSVNQ